ncbi:MAG: hypothetical protein Q8R28_09645, partial [Dehalococcoidia bacterium]|nr:hypothetical protein [Dehalococcoidia bacterium]
MKLGVRVKDVVPPGGWCYTTPETGYTATGAHYWQLEGLVRGHRMANGLSMEGWKEVFEDGLCRQLGIEHSHCGQARPISTNRRVHVDDV